MFNADFYPTPENVILTMVNGEDLFGKFILEPSAGKGNIIDYLKKEGAQVLSCEINEDLARICAAKSKFLANDFLTVQKSQISHIDAIYMNPPFSKDEHHILHAWNIAPDGCEIVALCNWNTIDLKSNRFRRQLASIIEMYGQATNISNVFSDSERPTNVEIGLVRLWKPAGEDGFGDFLDYEEDVVEEQFDGIMPYNAVRDCVNRYVSACKLYDQVAENAAMMNTLVGTFGVNKITFVCAEEEKEKKITEFKIELKKLAWGWVFSKMNMNKFMTEKLKEKINKQVEEQKTVPFTMRNIYKMFEAVVGTHASRMDEVLIEVFDRLTMHYSENRYNVEGWKTNSHYLVNKKFIIDGVIDSFDLKWYSYPSISYRFTLLDDFQKALNYLTGEKHALTIKSLYGDKEKSFGTWYDWGFFEVRVYKKGSLHAKFKDPKVWEQFNRSVAKAKGFQLPEKI